MTPAAKSITDVSGFVDAVMAGDGADLPDELVEKGVEVAGLATPDHLMARREAHLSGTLLAAIATPDLAIALATVEGSKRRGYQHADYTAAVIREELDRRNGR